MDTFSRKHRLRQLQLQKQQQQLPPEPHNYLTYNKENSQPFSQRQLTQHQFQYQSATGRAEMGGGGGTMTRKWIREDIHQPPETEDNEFKVVSVVSLQEPIDRETSRFSRKNVAKIHTPLNSSKPVSISLVSRCHPTTGGSTNDSLSQHSHSDSSGFSSSLYSTQVEIKHNQTTTATTTIPSANQSKLIDELDRLIMHVDSGVSPGESYVSCIDHRQQDSTLVRSNERVNSSLCGDEFSSFIAVTSSEQPKGFSLMDDVKRTEPRIDKCDNHYSTISETELSCDSDEDEKWLPLSYAKLEAQRSLSSLLEEHACKVHALLRLASGDRNVSMIEAFGRSDIPVSEELCIPIEFVAVEPKPTSRRIIHELEIVDLESGEELSEKTWRVSLEGSEVPFICPLGLELDWSNSSIEGVKQMKLGRDLRSLKHSVLQKLLKHQEEPLNKSLVSKISEHVNEFIDNYVEFHNNLKSHTTFSSDWHENWLFGSRGSTLEADWPQACRLPNEEEQEDEGQIASKRARLSSSGHSLCDLLRYSTLILNGNGRRRRSSLRYLTDQLPTVSESESSPGDLSKVDQFYEEQEEQVEELRLGKTNSLGLPDLCQLLLEEDWCNGHADTQMKQKPCRKLQVSYESSIFHPSNASGYLSFMAYGYFIKTPLLISPNTGLMKLAKLKQRTLASLENLLKDPTSRQLAQAPGSHQVRFTISITNVELVNRLQVVQFCAQVAGFLPISVRWFRGSQEISNKSSPNTNKQTTSDWPVWFYANYDYQYKTEWGSWYRFRRNRDWILFEIGCPNKEQDYDVSYRCVVENYCSQDECNFTLRTRLLKQSPTATLLDLNNNNKQRQSNDVVKEAGDSSKLARANKARAVLRTWSQRTLKPQARVFEEVATGELEQNLQVGHVKSSAKQCSADLTLNEDKFGKDFPYHPENLLKRLKENMFSLGTNRKPPAHPPSHQLEDYSAQVAEQQIHFEPLEESQAELASEELEKYSTPSAANYCGFTQDKHPISNGKATPKPQDRLSKITTYGKQQDNQSSCMINHETSELNSSSNKSEFIPTAFNNHDSRETITSSYANYSGQIGLCRDETGSHRDSNGNYELKTCVKSLISKFNMA